MAGGLENTGGSVWITLDRTLRRPGSHNVGCSAWQREKSQRRYLERVVRRAESWRLRQERWLQGYRAFVRRTLSSHPERDAHAAHIVLTALQTSSNSLSTLAKAVETWKKKDSTPRPRVRLWIKRIRKLRTLYVRRNAMLSTITAQDKDGTARTFTLQGSASDAKGNRSTYVCADLSTAGTPLLLKWENDVKPIGSDGSDKHRVMIQRVIRDSNERPHVFSATLTWSVPRMAASYGPEDVAKDVIAFLVSVCAIAPAPDRIAPSDKVTGMVDNLLP